VEQSLVELSATECSTWNMMDRKGGREERRIERQISTGLLSRTAKISSHCQFFEMIVCQ